MVNLSSSWTLLNYLAATVMLFSCCVLSTRVEVETQDDTSIDNAMIYERQLQLGDKAVDEDLAAFNTRRNRRGSGGGGGTEPVTQATESPTNDTSCSDCTVRPCSIEGEVQLVNGTDITFQEGRLEVCFNGSWSTVCKQGFDEIDGYVVCKQLLGNCDAGRVQVVDDLSSEFGIGNTPTEIAHIECEPWESRLLNCSFNTLVNCQRTSTSIVGLKCYEDCDDGDVRLVNGNSPNEGVVEICLESRWGMIAESGWGTTEGQVVCRQLGYSTTGGGASATTFTSSSAQYSRRTVHLDNVDCHGHEGTLLACEHKSATSQEGRAAGVRCSLSMDTPGVPPCEAASSVLAGVYITLVILIISSLAIIILQAYTLFKKRKEDSTSDQLELKQYHQISKDTTNGGNTTTSTQQQQLQQRQPPIRPPINAQRKNGTLTLVNTIYSQTTEAGNE